MMFPRTRTSEGPPAPVYPSPSVTASLDVGPMIALSANTTRAAPVEIVVRPTMVLPTQATSVAAPLCPTTLYPRIPRASSDDPTLWMLLPTIVTLETVLNHP